MTNQVCPASPSGKGLKEAELAGNRRGLSVRHLSQCALLSQVRDGLEEAELAAAGMSQCALLRGRTEGLQGGTEMLEGVCPLQ